MSELHTAVEGVSLGVLLGELSAGVCCGVLDAAGLAAAAGQGGVICVHEERSGCCEEHITVDV